MVVMSMDSMVVNPLKGVVDPKILSKLKKEINEKELISDIHDKRVMDLRDLLISKRGSSSDAVTLLGEGWLEGRGYDSNHRIQGNYCIFELNGKNNSQKLKCDREDGSVRIVSSHDGWFFHTTQEIAMRQDGVAVSGVVERDYTLF